ncbi:TPA: DUF799 family lipoprotein [Acinetobacter nosocomialis]|uniref:DUF799 domain-containing protein n=1 Tax=Acinetobacter calcoaceticus/baumannii complex TaxID=909768 RepID=UPI0002AE9CF8|nr:MULTISPECIES: GNA1162 family protein [Acinetobacter calcoaceticus/baumannii complex]ELW78112.1 lipoprotein, PF05643 family [Acinetobacter sp. OIFC021]EXE49262.1 putative lipoprotein [Acinetobacter sp. 766875]MDE1667013.1 DUF799 family lipoprotein [Acinetobacter nosocomialis]MDE9418135.1 DUF799 family lipoprotein [Acinetobacter nosocomialis]HAI56071.1 hypothetical protein [Acinetobacter nosocomialis]
MIKKFLIAGLVISSITFTGCAVTPAPNKDITAYKAHMPKSILVLPPVNDSPDVKATYSYWPTVIPPVAEAGYYVFPISVVDNMFKENGVTNGSDAQSIAPQKLQEIFGADAALYIRIKEYGSKYQVIQSVATVSADAKLVDLKTGDVIWTGEKKLSQSSSDNNSGLLGAVVGALVEQISSNFNDRAYPIASMVNAQLFTPTPYSPGTGLLYGPRSPQYQQDGIAK